MTDELMALLPCPFCGGSATVYEAFPASEYPWHVAIEHGPDCPDLLWDGVVYATKAKAIAAWNRRTELPALIAERDALREALEFYADKDAWNQPPVKVFAGLLGPEYENKASLMQRDRGKIARAALAGQP
jgi:hypothetical protein